MCEDGPRKHLCLACALTMRGMHAACPPPMPRAGLAHLHPTKQDCSSAALMRRVASAWDVGRRGPPVAHPWPTYGPGVVQAWPRRRTGLGWAPARRDVLMGGKIFGGNMARKLSKHPLSLPCCLLA